MSSENSGEFKTKVAVITEDNTSDKDRKIVAFLWGGAGLITALAVAWVVGLMTLKYSSSQDSIADLTHVVDELTANNASRIEQINDLQDQIETDNDRLECFNSYTNELTEAIYEFNSAGIGDLFPKIAAYLINTEIGRPPVALTELAEANDRVAAANIAYREALEAREAWIAAGRPLPCTFGS